MSHCSIFFFGREGEEGNALLNLFYYNYTLGLMMKYSTKRKLFDCYLIKNTDFEQFIVQFIQTLKMASAANNDWLITL